MCLHIVVGDPGLRGSLMVLLQLHGFAVETHTDARSLRRSSIATDDTVIVDLDLPNGQAARLVDWCRHYSESGRLIVLTGLTGRAMWARLGQMRTTAILTKPFQAADLLALL